MGEWLIADVPLFNVHLQLGSQVSSYFGSSTFGQRDCVRPKIVISPCGIVSLGYADICC